jgi:hypothetical protein
MILAINRSSKLVKQDGIIFALEAEEVEKFPSAQ